MLDLRFMLQVTVFCIAIFGGILTYLSPDVRAAVSSALANILPGYEEDIPPEEMKAQLDKLRADLRIAYKDIGPYWKVGKSIVPASPDDKSPPPVPSMPNGPYFMPLPSTTYYGAEIVKEDLFYSRFARRRAVLRGLLALNEDRCSKTLRPPVLHAFKRYQVHVYHHWAYEEMGTPYYYATIDDQHLVGLLYGLVWKGYLTWGDLPRPSFATPFRPGVFASQADGELLKREFNKRRACMPEPS